MIESLIIGPHPKILENGLRIIPNLQFFFLFLRLFIHQIIRRWSKPVTGLLTLGTLTDLTRSRTDLVVEKARLGQVDYRLPPSAAFAADK